MFPFFLFCQKAPSNEAAVDKPSGRRWKADRDDKMKPSKCTNCFELQKWPSLNTALLCVIFSPYSFSVFKMFLVSQGRSLLLKPSVSGKGNRSQTDNLFLSHPKSTTRHHLLSQRYVHTKTGCPLKLSRVEPGQYLDGRPPEKTRLLLEEVLVRPAGGAHPVFSLWVLTPQYNDRDTTLSTSTVFRMRR